MVGAMAMQLAAGELARAGLNSAIDRGVNGDMGHLASSWLFVFPRESLIQFLGGDA
jgi:hypothetical protein